MPISKSVISNYMSSGSLNFLRLLGATILFWLASLFCQEKVKRSDLLQLVYATIFGVLTNQILFLHGLSLTSPLHAAIISTVAPIITMLFSALFLKEPITWFKLIGIGIGITGALILVASAQNGSGHSSWKGDFLCFLCGCSYAIYLTRFKSLIQRYKGVTVMKWMFLFGTILSIPLLYHEINFSGFLSLPFDAWWRIAIVVLGATFFCYLMMPIAQKRIKPTTISMYNYVQPIVAVGISIWMGFDRLDFWQVVAIILVFVGVYFVTQSKTKKTQPSNQKLH